MNKDKIDFNKEVEDLDKKWSELGITSDAKDLFENLVEKHGEVHMIKIKQAVEGFYEITL